MHILETIGEYVWANKEWLFDGLGIALISAIGGAFLYLIRRRAKKKTPTKQASDHPYLPRGYDRAPCLEFTDGINAGVALSIELKVEQIFLLLKHFESTDSLLAAITPRIHIRMTQIMEAYKYEEAKQLREEFERQLVTEFAPWFAQRGVQLLQIGIGKFVRYDPRFQRLGDAL